MFNVKDERIHSMKNFKTLFGMMFVALMAASCTNDVNDVLAPEAPQKGYPFVATIAPKSFDATTRTALVEDTENGTISSTWEVGDKIIIWYASESDFPEVEAEVKKVASDGSATITATFETLPLETDDNATLIYSTCGSVDNYGIDLNGKLNADLDLRMANVTLKVVDGVVTLDGDVSLDAYGSILRISMTDLDNKAVGLKKLVVSSKDFYFEGADYSFTVTPDPGESPNVIYVAIPGDKKEHTFWFEAVDSNDKPYIAKATGTFAPGMFYQTTLKMATLGDLMNSDGTFSATAEEGKTPVGVIAYLGNDATVESAEVGGGHGLVMALKNAANKVVWSTDTENWQFSTSAKVQDLDALFRTTDVSGYTNTKTLVEKEEAENVFPAAYKAKNYTPTAPTSTTGWFLPSMQQWVKMMTGLGGLSNEDITFTSPDFSWFDNNHTAADKWEAALEKAGNGNYDSMKSYQYYWSSSEYSDLSAVPVGVDASGTGTEYGFCVYVQFKDYESSYFFVRPVLAF